MTVDARYRLVAADGWRVWSTAPWVAFVRPVVSVAEARDGWEHRSKHGRTRRLGAGLPGPAFLKSYRRYRWRDALKDLVRPVMAERAAMASVALEVQGFPVAPVVMIGIRRRLGVVQGAFVVSEDVRAPDAREFLETLTGRSVVGGRRGVLRALGAHVGRLHEAGFDHGDLVPSNVRVQGDVSAPRFVLIDNDRTRQRRRPVSVRQARRNLVQLNRFVVRGVTGTDRWRVLDAYCRVRGIERAGRRRLGVAVMRKTVERRRQFDGIVDAERMSFGALMRLEGLRSSGTAGSGGPAAEGPRAVSRMGSGGGGQ